MRGASPEVVIVSVLVTGALSVIVSILNGRFGYWRQEREERAADRLKRLDLQHARDAAKAEAVRTVADVAVEKALRTSAAAEEAEIALRDNASARKLDAARAAFAESFESVVVLTYQLRLRLPEGDAITTYEDFGENAKRILDAFDDGDHTTMHTVRTRNRDVLTDFARATLEETDRSHPVQDEEQHEGGAAGQVTRSYGRGAWAEGLAVSASALGLLAAALTSLLVISVASRGCAMTCPRPTGCQLAAGADALGALLLGLYVSGTAPGRRARLFSLAALTATAIGALLVAFSILDVAVAAGADHGAARLLVGLAAVALLGGLVAVSVRLLAGRRVGRRNPIGEAASSVWARAGAEGALWCLGGAVVGALIAAELAVADVVTTGSTSGLAVTIAAAPSLSVLAAIGRAERISCTLACAVVTFAGGLLVVAL